MNTRHYRGTHNVFLHCFSFSVESCTVPYSMSSYGPRPCCDGPSHPVPIRLSTALLPTGVGAPLAGFTPSTQSRSEHRLHIQASTASLWAASKTTGLTAFFLTLELFPQFLSVSQVSMVTLLHQQNNNFPSSQNTCKEACGGSGFHWIDTEALAI